MPEDKVRVSGKSPAEWQEKIALSNWAPRNPGSPFQQNFIEVKIEWEDLNQNVLEPIGQRRYKKKRVINLTKGYRITFLVEETEQAPQL